MGTLRPRPTAAGVLAAIALWARSAEALPAKVTHSLAALGRAGPPEAARGAARREAAAERLPGAAPRPDLLLAMQDRPPGAFFKLMEPLVYATGLTYDSCSGPEYVADRANSTIPPGLADGGVWERLLEGEADPASGGVHARAFVDRAARRAIVAFRGMCLNDDFRQCQVDKCFMQSIAALGVLSAKVFATAANCTDFASEMDYVAQADRLVRQVQEQLPGYALLLTGHSLGGAMAIVTAARQPGTLQAVSFAPTAFGGLLVDHVGLSEAEIATLPSQDLVATGDPYDVLINSVYVREAHAGAVSCLYEGAPAPFPCAPQMKEDFAFDQAHVPSLVLCKTQTHSWHRYERLVLQRREDGVTPRNLPTCGTNRAGSGAGPASG